MPAFILVLFLIIAMESIALARKCRKPVIPANYKTAFEYYDMGYDDRMSKYERRDWNGVLATKNGIEKTKFIRDIKAYNYGYDEASQNKPRRTKITLDTTRKYDQLWKEFAELLD